MDAPSILVIHRRSAYTEASDPGGSGSVSRLILREDPLVARILTAHECHGSAMEAVGADLERRGLAATWRYDLSGISPDDFDLVVTIGGDGTVLHASHSIGDTPVLAINSSPATSVGYFTAGSARDFPRLMDGVLDGTLERHRLFRMTVELNGAVVNNRVLNDALFSHDCPASTTRYVLGSPDGTEAQLSSGIWISTAAGSTAAIRAAGGRPMRFGSKRLQYAVREPGPFGGAEMPRKPSLVRGFVRCPEVLSIRSMTTAARVWIDGPHVVIPVEFGDTLVFSGGSAPLNLFGARLKK